MKKTLLAIAFGILCGLLGAGIIFLASRPPRGSAIQLLPPPTPRLWVVQVSGAVVYPGVYELPAGSRVRDAVQAAGGLTSEASISGNNLAAPLEDGKSIVIQANTPTPKLRPSPTLKPTVQIVNLPSATVTIPPVELQPTTAASTGSIDVNTATLEELDRLPDIGPVMAQRIIDYRTANGPFVAIEDIMDVPGIGPVTFEKIKGLITVGP